MTWFEAEGDLIDQEALQFDCAQQVRDALKRYPFGRLVEVRARERDGQHEEVVVVEVEPELPQDLVYDIRSVERLAIVFRSGGLRCPAVIALRRDFPCVPHLNWTPVDLPKDLCIYEDDWAEVRLRWTGTGFLHHMVQWLSLTATGELHGDDQGLEPFLFESTNVLVFPETLFEEGEADTPFAAMVVHEQQGRPYILKLQRFDDEEPRTKTQRVYCVTAVGQPTEQGALRDGPRNLIELVSVLHQVGVDLWAALGTMVKLWYSGRQRPENDDAVAVLVRLPRRREASGPVESLDHLAFEMGPMQELAMATGQVAAAGVGQPLVPVIGGRVDEGLAGLLKVVPLRPILGLDRKVAKRVSGLEPGGVDPKVVLVGVGALGSQIHSHLSRMGWGRWTLIDSDTLLPHNVARHRLGENAVGFSKIAATTSISKNETPHNAVERAFLADAKSVGNNQILAAYGEADWILDASTSIAVARFLGQDLDSPARRASLFLNPNGRDVVMLMEDAGRSVRLDALEAQYYRAVLCDNHLEAHIRREAGVRYSSGCRDVTARLGQDDVALASGLLCRQVRMAGECAVVAVWQSETNGGVRRIDIPISEVIRIECDGWNFVLDADVVERVGRLRRERLPKETGGVLIGYFDVPHRSVYIVDALPAPADSVEHTASFVRGYAGLRDELAAIEARTGGQVNYVGEWHSHPDGAGVGMSHADGLLLATITEEVRVDGWPGVMMIVGRKGLVGFYTQME